MKSIYIFAFYALACVLVLTGSIATAQSPAVSLVVSSTAVTIHPGDQNLPITATVNAGTYTGPVVVTLTGLPTGITVPPLVLTGSGSGTLNLSATASADIEDFPVTGTVGIYTATRTIEAVAVAGSTQVSMPITLTVSLSNPSFTPTPANINLPIFSINTNNVGITSKDTTVAATITITSADGSPKLQ